MSASDPPDAEWLTLTEGMEPYERFRYIARYVLRAALEDATRYAADERIFDELRSDDAVLRHLGELDVALNDDPSLNAIERSFLCSAVAEALAREQVDASCPWQAFRPRSDPLSRERSSPR